MQRIILHIDFDSFFASVEQQDNPLYRNRPLGVTATNGRTCIIAASREAKALGIKSPSRTYDAQRRCPQIIFVPAHFTRYWEISKKFINICKDFSPFVEVFSLDEVFMDITRTADLFGGTMPLVEKIKNRLNEELGECITASFGISHNKMLAKLASGLEKPNGIVKITPSNLFEVYKAVKLRDICGIGHRINDRLFAMGIYNLIDLNKAPLSALTSEFGDVEGKFLKNAGLGIDESEIVPYTESPDAKSVGRNYCLPENEYDPRKVLQNIYELCEEVGIKLRRLNKKARAVGIYLRGDENLQGRKTYSQYMNSGREIFEACMSLLCKEFQISNAKFKMENEPIGNWIFEIGNYWKFPNYVRQIGIWASYLQDADKVPFSIFETEKQRGLWQAVDKINEKFGDHTIRNGFLLYADKLTTVPNGFMADRYERAKFATDEKTRLDNLID